MRIVNVPEASTDLSRLIAQAYLGEEIVIADGDARAVRLVPVATTPPRRQRGRLRGEIHVPRSFFDPLPDEELDRWSR